MPAPAATGDPYLDSDAPLTPCDAVAALIILDDGRYLMQYRDPKPSIFFPDHWGCFGGGIEPGEDDISALHRELGEELGIETDPASYRYFTRLDFDMRFSDCGVLYRTWYEVPIDRGVLGRIRLQEGRQAASFAGRELLGSCKVTPYDTFALWMHVSRNRLTPISRPPHACPPQG